MVCNIKATREELAVTDRKIQEIAAQVTAYKTEFTRMGPVPETDRRFDDALAKVRAEADQIIAGMAEAQSSAIAHMDEHAIAWVEAGMPEDGIDRESIQAQDQIRQAWRDRIEALGSVIRDMERARPAVLVKEPEQVSVPVDVQAAIKAALGGRS